MYVFLIYFLSLYNLIFKNNLTEIVKELKVQSTQKLKSNELENNIKLETKENILEPQQKEIDARIWQQVNIVKKDELKRKK